MAPSVPSELAFSSAGITINKRWKRWNQLKGDIVEVSIYESHEMQHCQTQPLGVFPWMHYTIDLVHRNSGGLPASKNYKIIIILYLVYQLIFFLSIFKVPSHWIFVWIFVWGNLQLTLCTGLGLQDSINKKN